MVTQELVPPKEKAGSLHMSYEEFLALAGEDTHAEWVDGEVIEFMPAKPYHQITLKFLSDLLSLFTGLFDLGVVLIAPLEMRLSYSSREPDIMFVSKSDLSRLTKERIEGAANLVVEIISDDSVGRDRQQKFKEYREAGVPEYWIIDPRPGKLRADFYCLDEEGNYDLFATEDDQKVESRTVAGFWLRPSWLWQAAEVDPFLAFCEIRGLPPEKAQENQQLLRSGA